MRVGIFALFISTLNPALAQEVIPRPADVADRVQEIQKPKTIAVPEGTNVEAKTMPEISVTFPEVTKKGSLTSRVLFEGPRPPAGYLAGNPPILVELSSDAQYSGLARVCINYAPDLFPDRAADLRVLRRENDSWSDETRTIDREKFIVCAEMKQVGLLLLVVRSIEGLYEDLALTVRQIPETAVQQELAGPVLKSREAALNRDRDTFIAQLADLRTKLESLSAEKLSKQYSDWIHYFLSRIEQRVLQNSNP